MTHPNHAPEVTWGFHSAVPIERATRLLSWQTYAEIIERLSSCVIAPLWWEAGRDLILLGSNRASFELTVDTETFDAFFNAPVGYRGQYARSQTHGEAANRLVLDTLTDRLLDRAAESPIPRDHVL